MIHIPLSTPLLRIQYIDGFQQDDHLNFTDHNTVAMFWSTRIE